jgi:hypothetical protein
LKAQEAATRLCLANSANVDAHGRLYVSESLGNSLGIYSRDKTGSIKLIKKVTALSDFVVELFLDQFG